MTSTILETSLAELPVRRGKVRDIYDLGDRLLLVSTDRISAFDWVLPTGIPDKGRVLTQLSRFWFDRLDVPNHLHFVRRRGIRPAGGHRPRTAGRPEHAGAQDRGRADRVRRPRLPVRLGLEGISADRRRLRHRAAGGSAGERPAAGADLHAGHQGRRGGHDQNISFNETCQRVGRELAEELRRRSLDIYKRGAEYAQGRGIIIADTKFEFGQIDGELILIDEVLTPDSSRFWPADGYEPGQGQPSFDKQFVRDWLTTSGWDKNSPPPALPPTWSPRPGPSTSRPSRGSPARRLPGSEESHVHCSRIATVVFLLAVAGFCTFGFLATFEPLEGAAPILLRVIYGVVIFACLAQIVWLARPKKKPV